MDGDDEMVTVRLALEDTLTLCDVDGVRDSDSDSDVVRVNADPDGVT